MDTLNTAAHPKIIYLNLEGLRGFAALVVVWCHAVEYYHYLDPNYSPTGLIGFQAPAHFSVLLFFSLSGYVIGISNRKSITRSTLVSYLKKRFIRIYPIYISSILITLIISINTYPARTIVGNLSFLQVAVTPVINEISPIWSLNSEILFYILFIPISFFKLNYIITTLSAFTIGLINLWLYPNYPLLSTYAFGFTFWSFGLLVAKHKTIIPNYSTPYRILLSTLLLFISLVNYNFLETLFSNFTNSINVNLHYPAGADIYEAIITAHDFTYLPYVIAGILLFADNRFTGSNFILPILWLLPLISIIQFFIHWNELTGHAQYIIPILSYTAAIFIFFIPVVLFNKIGKQLMIYLSRVGSISYGLYIIHVPIMTIFKQIDYFSGSGLTYMIRFLALIFSSLLAAWYLEKKFQPLVKRLFRLGT